MSAQAKTTEGISARLRRLPGQFLLALLNATSILVIAAAILAILAVSRVEQAADRITDAVLAEVDVKPQTALDEIRALSTEVQELRAALFAHKPGDGALLEPAREKLESRLDGLQMQLDRLAEARRMVVQEGMSSIADSLADIATLLSGCRIAPVPEPEI